MKKRNHAPRKRGAKPQSRHRDIEALSMSVPDLNFALEAMAKVEGVEVNKLINDMLRLCVTTLDRVGFTPNLVMALPRRFLNTTDEDFIDTAAKA